MAPPPPPPTQAGKFKPRKPAKKIRVGASKSQHAPAAPSATAALPQATLSSSGGGTAAVGRARSQGRDGGGGRAGQRGGGGRGRAAGRHFAPVQQGQAFFTAAPSASASQPSRAKRAPPQQQQQPLEEEIVGTLGGGEDTIRPDAVGSSNTTTTANKKSAAVPSDAPLKGDSAMLESESLEGSTPERTYLEGYYSDSDSSQEVEEDGAAAATTSAPEVKAQGPQPLTPVFKAPPTASSLSLFTGSNDDNSNNGSNKLFLMQFPTRLPPVVQQAQPKVEENSDNKDGDDVQFLKSTASGHASKVATAPVHTAAFDQALNTAVAGKVGKLQVLRNGKMRLVLENNGTVLQVAEGMASTFRQDAVRMDLKNARYSTVGRVGQTLVVTPDIANAFGN